MIDQDETNPFYDLVGEGTEELAPGTSDLTPPARPVAGQVREEARPEEEEERNPFYDLVGKVEDDDDDTPDILLDQYKTPAVQEMQLRTKLDKRKEFEAARDRSGFLSAEEWGTLDPAESTEKMKGLRRNAKDSEDWWKKLGDTLEAQTKATPDDNWLKSWALRNVREMQAHGRYRQHLVDQMEAGLLAKPKFGQTRQLSASLARGAVETGVGGMAAGSGRGAQMFGLEAVKVGSADPTGFTGAVGVVQWGTGTVLKQLGDFIQAKAKELFPTDPALEHEFSSKLSHGAGTMVALIGPGMTAAVLTKGGPKTLGAIADDPALAAAMAQKHSRRAGIAASGVGGATMEAEALSEEAEEAFEKGAKLTQEDFRNIYLSGLAIGATEVAPIANLFSGKGLFMREVVREMIEESGQEFFQTWMENVVAMHHWDPQRRWDDGAWEAAAIGGILGAHMAASTRAYNRALGREEYEAGEVEEAPSATFDLDEHATPKEETFSEAVQAEGLKPEEKTEKPVREARARGGRTKTDVQPLPAVEEPEREERGTVTPLLPQSAVDKAAAREVPRPASSSYQTRLDDLVGVDEEARQAREVSPEEEAKPYSAQGARTDIEERLAELRGDQLRDIAEAAGARNVDARTSDRDLREKIADTITAANMQGNRAANVPGLFQDVDPATVDQTRREHVERQQQRILDAIEQSQEADITAAVEADLPAINADLGDIFTQIGLPGLELADEAVRAIARDVVVNNKPTERALEDYAIREAVNDPDVQRVAQKIAEDKEVNAAIEEAIADQDVAEAIDTALSDPDVAEAAEDLTTRIASAIDPYEAFRSVLAGTTPRKGWAKALGIPEADLAPLISQARQEGLVRVDKNGVVRRTPLAKTSRDTSRLSGAPSVIAGEIGPETSRRGAEDVTGTLTIDPSVRFDGAVEARERQTGRPVKQATIDYADEIEAARNAGTDPQPILDRVMADKAMKKNDVHDLASIAGYPDVAKSWTKKRALETILERHEAAQAQNPTLDAIREAEAQDAERQRLRESERDVSQDGVSEGLRPDEEGGDVRGAPGDGGRGRGGDVRGGVRADAEQPRPAGGVSREGGAAGTDTADGTGIGQPRPDTRPATGLSQEQKARVEAEIAADKAAADQAARDRQNLNYEITEADKIGMGGPKVKVRANIEAIRTLRTLEDEARGATAEEKAKLVKYTGWGAFSQAMFRETQEQWKKEREAFRSLVSEDEYESASTQTQNQNFTSPDVIKGMWDALEYLGFKGGRAIEPGAGVGHFIGLTPKHLREATDWTAVEIDLLTGGMAKAIYEAADVRVAGYETQRWPNDYFDLAISNVPFSDVGVHDPDYKQKLALHDYYFVKSLDKVRPGGMVAFITSDGTLDKKNSKPRREMAKRGTFLGAVRLPGGSKGAFKANAGTDVTTDIVFFRKRLPGEAEGDQSWLDVAEVETPEGPATINRYFAENPDMMLGDMRLTGSMYVRKSKVLIGPTDKLDQRIMDAVKRGLPENAMTERGVRAEELAPVDARTDGIKEGAYYQKDGKLYRKQEGVGLAVTLPKAKAEVMAAFMGLRDTVNDMLAVQSGETAAAPGDMDLKRATLNTQYDAFVKKYGPINKAVVSTTVRKKDGKEITTRRYPNFTVFEADPDAYKVGAIEIYDEKTDKAKKAAIFTEDILAPYVAPEITSPADALAVSLNETGRVDMGLIAERMGVSEKEAATALGDQTYLDPAGEVWRTSDEYLAGDVVEKLDVAKTAAELDGKYKRNVEALEAVRPAPIPRQEIMIPFGARYVPTDVYKKFLEDGLGLRNVEVAHSEETGQWSLVKGSWDYATGIKYGLGPLSRWGVKEIVEAALNSQTVVITTTGPDGEKIRLTEKEAEARTKIAGIREMFTGDIETGTEGWVWQDFAIADRMEAIYNHAMNRIVEETHDGSHLNFPGLARIVTFPDGGTGQIYLTPARVNAIWRIIKKGNTLLNHAVGAGKTWTSIMAAMEMKRLGMIQRPMFVVPNHMLGQFSTEFYQAYPNAKLLIATASEMSAKNRKAFAARIAADKWDGIIIRHDTFSRLPMSNKAYEEFYDEHLAEINNALAQAEGAGDEKTVKDVGKIKKRLEKKLKDLASTETKDEGTTFEELGVDFLFVDEAHLFKNLYFQTTHTRVKGIPSGSESKRATDLYVKLKYLEKSRPGRSAVFMTATPIANSMAELYVMQKYLQEDQLRKYGVSAFDSWAATFGMIESKSELGSDSRTYKDTERFRRFVNIPELGKIVGEVMDTQTPDMLGLKRPAVKGGKPEVVTAQLGEGESQMIDALIDEMEEAKTRNPGDPGPNFISLFTQGIQIATDARLVDPRAPFNPKGKIAKAVENIHSVWKEGNADPAAPNKAQMVFLDMGVPGSKGQAAGSIVDVMAKKAKEKGPEGDSRINEIRAQLLAEARAAGADEDAQIDEDAVEVEALLEGKFNLYEDIRKRLVAKGIPKDQIAFIHEAPTTEKKEKLFSRVKRGEVRVLIGSTSKMGVGTNVQKQLYAMHHIDAPWRPADVEQRDGRIVRQGNNNAEVRIFRYVTEKSFDAYRWQILESKSNFIGQFYAGQLGHRHAEDIDPPLPEAAELKAAATGNPLIMERAELERAIRQLEAAKRTHHRNQQQAAAQIGTIKQDIERIESYQSNYEADEGLVTDLKGDAFRVTIALDGKRSREVDDRKKAGGALKTYLTSLGKSLRWSSTETDLGTISGFAMKAKVWPETTYPAPQIQVQPIIEGAIPYEGEKFTLTEGTDPVQIIQRWVRMVGQIPLYAESARRRRAELTASLPRLEEAAKITPFSKADQLAEKQKRMAEVVAELTPKEPEQEPTEAAPTQEEMERIGLEAFQSDDYVAAVEAAKAVPQTMPEALLAPATPREDVLAWVMGRTYNVNGKETSFAGAVNAVKEKAASYIGEGQAKHERRATVILGLSGSGKSSISGGFAQLDGAAVFNGDDTKTYIPEYDNGRGSMAVHEEASLVTKIALDQTMKTGANVILEKTGSSPASITGTVNRLKKDGYEVQLVLVDVPKWLARYQIVKRFRGDGPSAGRVVPPEFFENLNPAEIYTILQSEGAADGYTRVERTGLEAPWRFTEIDQTYQGIEDAVERSSGGVARVVRDGRGESGDVRGDARGLADEGVVEKGLTLASLAAFDRTARLAMDRASRLKRAEAMGFDTSRTLYHGTRSQFSSFRPGASGAIYLTPSQDVANYFASGEQHALGGDLDLFGPEPFESGSVVPVYTKKLKLFDPADRDAVRALVADLSPKGDAVKISAWELDGKRKDKRKVHPEAFPRVLNGENQWRYIEAPEIQEFIRKHYDGFLVSETVDGKTTSNIAVFDPENIRSVNAAFDPSKKRSALVLASISAFHGSQEDFKEFDLGRIKTGVGLSKRGWGVNLIQNKAAAQFFASNADERAKLYVGDAVYTSAKPDHVASAFINRYGGRDEAIENAERILGEERFRDGIALYGRLITPEVLTQARDILASDAQVTPFEVGRVYSVEANVEESDLLDWDLPLSQQPAAIADKIEPLVAGLGMTFLSKRRITGGEFYGLLGDAKMAAGRLEAAGVKGVAYTFAREDLARDLESAGDVLRGMTVFDPKDVAIKAKNGRSLKPEVSDQLGDIPPPMAASIRAFMLPGAAPERPGVPAMSPDSLTHLPELAQRIKAELEAMLPADIAVRVVDRMFSDQFQAELRADYQPALRLVRAALMPRGETDVEGARRQGRHEVIHALRMAGVFTDKEWALLVAHAKKVGIEKEITALDAYGQEMDALPRYRAGYEAYFREIGLTGAALDAAVEEMIDQELVAKLMEKSDTGFKYPSVIEQLLERIRRILEAIQNAIAGMEPRAAQSILDDVIRGRIGARPPGEGPLAVAQMASIGPLRVQRQKSGPGTYSVGIYDQEGPVGEMDFTIGGKNRDTAYVQWMDLEDAPGRASVGDIRQLREAFRELFPKIKKWQGMRISGAKATAYSKKTAIGEDFDDFQTIVMASLGQMRLVDPWEGADTRLERHLQRKDAVAERVGRKLDPNSEETLYHNEIYSGDRPIGEVEYYIRGDTAFVRWIDWKRARMMGERASVADIRQLAKALRRKFPKVKKFEGDRISGAKARAAKVAAEKGQGFSQRQSIVMPSIAAFQGSPHSFNAERLVEYPDGRQEYIEGTPGFLPNVPEGARVVRDFPAGRLRGEKIGSGEGAQVYGHGHYSAGRRGVAEWYKVNLANQHAVFARSKDPLIREAQQVLFDGRMITQSHGYGADAAGHYVAKTYALGQLDRKIEELRSGRGIFGRKNKEDLSLADHLEEVREVIATKEDLLPEGHLYELEIDAEPDDFLDWHRSLRDQTPKIKKAISAAFEKISDSDVDALVAEHDEVAAKLDPLTRYQVDISADQTVDEVAAFEAERIEKAERDTKWGARFIEAINKELPYTRQKKRYQSYGEADGAALPEKITLDDYKRVVKELTEKKDLVERYRHLRSELFNVKEGLRVDWGQTFDDLNYGANEFGDVVSSSVALSERLRKAGIPGIKYLDQGSREQGEGSYNYVVFPGNEHLIDIVAKDGKPLPKQETKDILTLASIAQVGPPSDLEMSPEARKARAEEMGFDTSRVWYHGTHSDIDAFKKGDVVQNFGGAQAIFGHFFTGNPEYARRFSAPAYTGQRGGPNIVPVYLRGKLKEMNIEVLDSIEREWSDGSMEKAEKMADDLVSETIAEGFSGIRFVGISSAQFGLADEVAIFDPSNIRSVNAAFDPAEEQSPLLMASLGTVGRITPWQSTPIGEGFQTEATAAPEKSLSDLVTDTVKALGLPVKGFTKRHGRINPGLKAAAGRRGNVVAGQYDPKSGVARIVLPNDLATLTHEGGHALESSVKTRDAIEAVKQAFVEELVVPPTASIAPPQLQAVGFSGLEIDAETQLLLAETALAEAELRRWSGQVATAKTQGRRFDQAAYDAAQDAAVLTRARLDRRLGGRTAKMVMDDVLAHVLTMTTPPRVPQDLAPHISQRFSETGVPVSRGFVTATRKELSEGFAEWFQYYMVNSLGAQTEMPALYRAFEDAIDAVDPELLERLQRIQDGVQALTATSAAGAVRSRVQSTRKPGAWGRMGQRHEEAMEEASIAAGTAARQGAGQRRAAAKAYLRNWAAAFSDWSYAVQHGYLDQRHPMKRAMRFLEEVAQHNGLLDNLREGEVLAIKTIDDPYKHWRLAEHAKTHATIQLQEGVLLPGQVNLTGPSLRDAMIEAFGGRKRAQWSDENVEAFGSYLITKRMIAEFDRYDRGELDQLPDRVIDRDVWIKARDQLEAAYPRFAAAAEIVYEFNQNVLRQKFERGFIPPELYNELRARTDYVPLNRIMDDGAPSTLSKAKGQNKRKIIYRFQGSTRDFINPLESIVQDMYATTARIALNETIKAMVKMAKAVGPGGGAIIEKVSAKEQKAVKADIRQVLKAAAAAQNLSQQDQDTLHDMIDDLFDQNAAGTIFKATDTGERGENILYLYEDGKRTAYKVGDMRIGQDIFDGFVAFGQGMTDPFINGLSLTTQVLRAGITKAPAYPIANFVRDQPQIWALSEDYTPFVTGFKGVKHLRADDPVFKRYQAFAGLMGGVDAHLIDTAATKRDALMLRTKGFFAVPAKTMAGEKWKQFLRFMEGAEAASRLGHFDRIFKRSIRDQMPPDQYERWKAAGEDVDQLPPGVAEAAAFEAAYGAHDVMDFSRRGSKVGGAARIVAFLNASVQALDAARRTISGERNTYLNYRELASPYIKASMGSPLSVAEKRALPNSARIWVKVMKIGMIGAALTLMYLDDDEYDEFNDYMRATHWFVKIPFLDAYFEEMDPADREKRFGIVSTRGSTWLRIPKPFELATISNAAEAAIVYAAHNDPRAGEQFINSLWYTMSPPHEVNAANLYYEWQSGRDLFRDRDIVPMQLSKLPPELQFNAYTSELGKLVGKATGSSPQFVDHFMGGLFGTWGRDIMSLSDSWLPTVQQMTDGALPGVSMVERADKGPSDSYFLSRFTRRAARGSLSGQEFWEQMSQDGGEFVMAAEGYKKALSIGDRRGARDLIENLDDNERAYAYLEGNFSEKDQDLHPMNRARQVVSAAGSIRKEMTMGRLIKASTKRSVSKKHREPEEIIVRPAIQKIVNEALEDMQVREQRNALIVIGHPGWAHKRIKPTEGLWEELRHVAPEVAEELEYRLNKGTTKVYSFDAVRLLWPEAQERLLRDREDASLADLRGEAIGMGRDHVIRDDIVQKQAGDADARMPLP